MTSYDFSINFQVIRDWKYGVPILHIHRARLVLASLSQRRSWYGHFRLFNDMPRWRTNKPGQAQLSRFT